MRNVVATALIGISLAASVSTANSQGMSQPMDMEKRMVLTEKDAVAMLPAEVVCEPMVTQMHFSDSGRYLLLSRQALKFNSQSLAKVLAGQGPPPIEHSLLVWDSKDRETRTLWKAGGENVQIQSLQWLPGTEIALALVTDYSLPPAPKGAAPNGRPARPVGRQSLLRIVPGSDRAQVLGGAEDFEREAIYLHVSPVSALALVRRVTRPVDPQTGLAAAGPAQETVTVLGADGRPGKTFPIPSADFTVYDVEWSEDGSPVLVGFVPKSGNNPPHQKRLLFNPKTGATSAPARAPAPPVVARKAELDTNAKLGVRLKRGAATVKEGPTTLPVGTLWLEALVSSEAPRALISADSQGGRFTSNGEAVLFQSQGGLMAVPLIRIDKAVMLAAREQAKRMQLVSNGKQLGLAAHMYAADHDDALPGGDDIQGKLEPYLKNSSLFEGFSYTFPGGPLKNVESPAETEMGFIAGPGGRAVVYVDGHVKWKSDK